MLKTIFSVILSLTLFAFSLCVAAMEDVTIHVVTEDAYPLQYIKEDDGEEQLVGPAFDIIKKTLTQAGFKFEVNVLPWARAYAMASSQPNTLIFSIARTPAREQVFHWVGALMELNYFFYGLKKNFPDEDYVSEQLRHKRVGTILDSATYQYIVKKGFSNIYAVSSPKQNYEKLLNGRIDIFPANAASFQASCVKFKQDCQPIKKVASVGIPPSYLYFALSKQTDNKVVERVRNAFNKLQVNQKLEANFDSLQVGNPI